MHYYQVITEGRLEKVREIAEWVVDEFECKVVSNPSPGMVMIKHADPIEKAPFYIGEAFVTQCEVEINGDIGYGCILGNEPERALYCAIIDARLGNGLSIPDDAAKILSNEISYIRENRDKESKQVLKTKVNFDVKKGL